MITRKNFSEFSSLEEWMDYCENYMKTAGSLSRNKKTRKQLAYLFHRFECAFKTDDLNRKIEVNSENGLLTNLIDKIYNIAINSGALKNQ